eukprot:364223-Chlamydomonas_euryale.AAC.6
MPQYEAWRAGAGGRATGTPGSRAWVRPQSGGSKLNEPLLRGPLLCGLLRWPSVWYALVRWASPGRALIRWASVRWASVRWASVRWASVRWASVRWASVRWASETVASKGGGTVLLVAAPQGVSLPRWAGGTVLLLAAPQGVSLPKYVCSSSSSKCAASPPSSEGMHRARRVANTGA